MDAGHLAVMFAEAAAAHGSRPATRVRSGDEWKIRSYSALASDVKRLAGRLVALGLDPGDRVALFSTNVPEWSLADLACASAGLVSVPLYPSSSAEQVRHILADSGCKLAFIGGAAELAKLASTRAELPELARLVAFEPVDAPDVTSLADEIAAAPADLAEVDARMAAASATDLATIIYTSGTTGEPKGVMLTHAGFTFQMEVLTRELGLNDEDSSLCFLPLSHALERAWTYCVLGNGCMNTYVPDPRTVAELMILAQPNMLVSVPRLYEKVFFAAKDKVAGSPVKQRLMAWAVKVGAAFHRAVRDDVPRSAVQILKYKLADKLVLSNVRAAIGGPKKVLSCGGAPLRTEIEEFLFACGLLVLQGYGLTETSPAVSFPSPSGYRFGTVGRVIVGGEVRIAEADEICYRGPNLMLGYWGRPEETAAALVDGWLHTGDVGHLDEDGYLTITDRIKDLIVTSNGKNVAPATIERLLAADPLFEYTLLLGDNRPYLTLLVAPSLPHLEDIGKQLQLTWAQRDELLSHPAIIAELRRRVSALTEKLANYEQIRDLRLVVEEFTQENGLLTPTLKVKRREVERRFAQLVDEMYARAGKPRN